MASGKESDEAADTPDSPKNVYKDPDDGRQRFLLELEFVQCLANPTYIHFKTLQIAKPMGLTLNELLFLDRKLSIDLGRNLFHLAQNRYFEDEAFIGYLKYLQYWQRPDFHSFVLFADPRISIFYNNIRYPHCLFFLELLQNANFRNAMAHPGNKELAHRQQFYFWKNYRNNRLKHILPRPLPEPVATPATSAPPQQQPMPPVTPSIPGTAAPASALSPMQYANNPGSTLAKVDMRNSGVDRRKRKCVNALIFVFVDHAGKKVNSHAIEAIIDKGYALCWKLFYFLIVVKLQIKWSFCGKRIFGSQLKTLGEDKWEVSDNVIELRK
ncbi:hypothetical protein FEM48_Zijuj03G0125100 [Ziziphus jujuba var. spinosa]|uniref:Mediator of RNA polymerase II transcription subunit 31 n=1 Tax=Ziziphus jujuba var. spinosa TaxID=714518 RepID=A0A978VQB5_ZIZJJ|nr:hypothetical protein FEM48_Zijuj03G0125100 [Ziziphus jujuba var. spinosa]